MLKKALASLAIALLAVSGLASPAQAADPTITGLTLSPGVTTLTADQTTTFTLMATLSDGTTANVTEQASWTPNGGGFTGIPGQRGVFTAVAQGSWTLTATVGGRSATAAVTITPGAPTSLNVLPTTAQLTADGLLPMEFYGVDTDGNGFDVSNSVVLSTTDPKGSVSPAGYTPGMAGTWHITARLGDLTDSTTVTITPGMLASLTLTPGELTVDPGDSAALQVRGDDARGNEVQPNVTLRTTNEDIATVDEHGNVHAKKTGQTNVIAEADGGTLAVLPLAVSGEVQTPVVNQDIVAVSRPDTRQPQVAADEVEVIPEGEVTAEESAGLLSTAEQAPSCENIAHPWVIILVIAHLILLSVFFTALHRARRYPWWWVPPIALTAALLGVYAGAFCNDTYLWWPWAIVGITVVFLSVYYQRLDDPAESPPAQPPQT